MTHNNHASTAVVDLSDINPHILFNNDNGSNDDDQKNTKTSLSIIYSYGIARVPRERDRGKLDVLLL